MYLKQLVLMNFKNFEELELSFSKNLNCFIGNNGAGKTNIMDAIYYLSFCKSFLNITDSQSMRHGSNYFMIQGEYQHDGTDSLVNCALKRGQKKVFKYNKKEYQRLADHIGKVPLIIISPSDYDLISGASEERRKFIDSLISQYDAHYLNALIRYNKALLQRNKLLKQFAAEKRFSEESINIWDEQMCMYAQIIHPKRQAYINQITPFFQKYYEYISKGREQIEMSYKSQLNEMSLADLLQQNRAKDRILQYTSVGVHRDDIDFKLGDYKLKKLGSQGQKKTYLVALKMAQFDFIKEMASSTPILVLDDVFDKLDADRVEQIMKLVTDNHFGQIFITDTNREHLHDIINKLDAESSLFSVQDGKVKLIGYEKE